MISHPPPPFNDVHHPLLLVLVIGVGDWVYDLSYGFFTPAPATLHHHINKKTAIG
jgi:hypothetical protein